MKEFLAHFCEVLREVVSEWGMCEFFFALFFFYLSIPWVLFRAFREWEGVKE